MAKSDFLNSAIVEAKQLKESIQASAKFQLEEYFQPTLQRMISSRIAEEEGEEMEDEVNVDVMSPEGEEEGGDTMGFGSFEDEPAEEEVPEEEGEGEDLELEALMRELDGMDGMESDMDIEEEFGMEGEMDIEEGEEDDWQDPVDDLETSPTMESVEDMELEEALDAMLREEEGLGDMLDMGQNKEDGSVYDENPPSGPQFLERRKLRNENKKLKKDLNEAYRAVTTLKKTLNDVNLLNAKLMYTTKTFRAYNLNEAQQQRILDSFDRATSVREVKLVYTTIAESMNRKPIKRVNEGLASKSVKAINPGKRQLNENSRDIVDKSLVERMQRLANIKRTDDF